MGTPQLARILRPSVGVIMLASFIIMFLRYWHHSLVNRDDTFRAKDTRKTIVNEEVGDTERYNSGQKCIFWAAIIFLALLLVNGVIIRRPYFAPAFPTLATRFALMLHSFAAVALIMIIMVHIYAALWVKGTIIAMVEEWVISVRVKKYHPRWYREVHKTTEKKAE